MGASEFDAGRRKFVRCLVCGYFGLVGDRAFGQHFPHRPQMPDRPMAAGCGNDLGAGGLAASPVVDPDDPTISELASALENEQGSLRKYFDVSPRFSIVNSSDELAETLRGTDGTSIYYSSLLANLSHYDSEKSARSTAIGVLAHEWAHAFQYDSSLDEKRFLWETHADYMSGWYLGTLVRKGRSDISVDHYESFFKNHGSTKGYFDPEAYGSPTQRALAVRMGADFARNGPEKINYSVVACAATAGYAAVENIRKGAQ